MPGRRFGYSAIAPDEVYWFAPLGTWHRGRAVLIGDAAHAMTPDLGQGGAQAIEDALAVERHVELPAALTDFERRRRRRVLGIVRQARLYGRVSHGRPSWLRAARDAVLRATPAVVQERRLEALLRPAL